MGGSNVESKKSFWAQVSNEDIVNSLSGRLYDEAGLERPNGLPERAGELESAGLLNEILGRVPEMSEQDRFATKSTLLKAIKGIGERGSIRGDIVYSLFKIFDKMTEEDE